MKPTGLNSRLLLCACLLPALSVVHADSMRCGRKVISNGDSSAELARYCGDPQFRERGSEQLQYQGRAQKLRVERWYYQKNVRSVQRIVLVYQGRIVAIENGGR